MVFRVSRGVLIAVFRLGTSNGRDRGEVQVKHWELLLVSKSLLVCSPLLPVLGLNIVWSSHAKDLIWQIEAGL